MKTDDYVDRFNPTKRVEIIGLAGPQGVGKSTYARTLGGTVLSFADPLYNALAAMLSTTAEELRAQDKNAPIPALGVFSQPEFCLKGPI